MSIVFQKKIASKLEFPHPSLVLSETAASHASFDPFRIFYFPGTLRLCRRASPIRHLGKRRWVMGN